MAASVPSTPTFLPPWVHAVPISLILGYSKLTYYLFQKNRDPALERIVFRTGNLFIETFIQNQTFQIGDMVMDMKVIKVGVKRHTIKVFLTKIS